MTAYFQRAKRTLAYRILSAFIACTFSCSYIVPPGYAQGLPATVMNLPVPGTVVPLSAGFVPPRIIGMTIHADNPLMFDFMVDPGDSQLTEQALQDESLKLVKYFLASMTVPAENLWVNLSPYEKDRIIPAEFGQTEMGTELLAQDYLLKQLTASLMNPEDEPGKKFWDRVYAKAQKMFGTTEIPMNTFNKIWILPEKAVVHSNGLNAFVIESRLKVMLEEDYLALEHHTAEHPDAVSKDVVSGISSSIIKEVLLPEIEKEVNEGKTFANLRQIYNSMILAAWYKENLKESLLGKIYADQGKTEGLTIQDKETSQKIYSQYVEAFKKGVYNFIKEDIDPATNEMIPRKYFSGGIDIKNINSAIGSSSITSNDLNRFVKRTHGAHRLTAGIEGGNISYEMEFGAPVPIAASPITFEEAVNTSRKPVVGYNMKGELLTEEVDAFLDGIAADYKANPVNPDSIDIVVLFAEGDLKQARVKIDQLVKAGNIPEGFIRLGAQNVRVQPRGAYTAHAPSIDQLKNWGVEVVLLGHSEIATADRGEPSYVESDELIAQKVKVVIDAGLRPIIAYGETKSEKNNNLTEEVLTRQLKVRLSQVSPAQMLNGKLVLAYEPVWSIGPGATPATPEDAEKYTRVSREIIFNTKGSQVAAQVPIQYGGNMNPDNVGALSDQGNIDGGLVGGASKKWNTAAPIYRKFAEKKAASSSSVLSAEIQTQLRETAAKMAPLAGGILAADESTGSAKARLDLVGLENTPENRQKMRELMLTTPGLKEAGINSVILYSETFDNVDSQGRNLISHHLLGQGILPGIKTDGGLIDDPESAGEKIPDAKGLQKLPEVLAKFKAKGAVFTKWRTTQAIDSVKGLPTDANIRKNGVVQGKQARLTQEAGLVPIVEPEVLLDGTHDIAASYEATTRTLELTFDELIKEGVWLPGMILKTSMILSGNKAANRADSETVGFQTLKGLLKAVPSQVPAIVFLSGGQKDDEVVKNLDAVIRASQSRFNEARDAAAEELIREGKIERAEELAALTKAPWEISYSFGRGLQRPALLAWAGTDTNFTAAQEVMRKTAQTTQAARLGRLASSPMDQLSVQEKQRLQIALRRFPNLVSTRTAEKLTQLGLRGAYKHVVDIWGREISNEQKLQDLKYLFVDLYQKTEARAIEDLEIMVTQKQANEAITKEDLVKIKQAIKDTSDGFAKRIYVETAKELGVIMMVRVSEGFGRDEVAESLKSNEVVVPDDLRGEIDRVIIAIQDGEKLYRSTSGKIYGIVNAIIDVIEGTDMFVTNSDDKMLEKIEDFESGSTSVIVTGDGVADLGNSPDGYVGQFLTNLGEHAEAFKQKTVAVNGQTYSLRDPELYMAYPEKLEEYLKFLAQIRRQQLEDIQEEIVLMNRSREADMIQAIQKLQQRIPGLKVVGKDQKGIKDGTVAHGLKAVMTPQMYEALTGKAYGIHKTVITVGGSAEGFMNLAVAGGFKTVGAVGGLRVFSSKMNKNEQGVEVLDKSQRYNFRVDKKAPEGDEPKNIRELRKEYGDAEKILEGKKVFFEDNVKGGVTGAFSFISTNGVFSVEGVNDAQGVTSINVLRIEAEPGQTPILKIVNNKLSDNELTLQPINESESALTSSPVADKGPVKFGPEDLKRLLKNWDRSSLGERKTILRALIESNVSYKEIITANPKESEAILRDMASVLSELIDSEEKLLKTLKPTVMVSVEKSYTGGYWDMSYPSLGSVWVDAPNYYWEDEPAPNPEYIAKKELIKNLKTQLDQMKARGSSPVVYEEALAKARRANVMLDRASLTLEEALTVIEPAIKGEKEARVPIVVWLVIADHAGEVNKNELKAILPHVSAAKAWALDNDHDIAVDLQEAENKITKQLTSSPIADIEKIIKLFEEDPIKFGENPEGLAVSSAQLLARMDEILTITEEKVSFKDSMKEKGETVILYLNIETAYGKKHETKAAADWLRIVVEKLSGNIEEVSISDIPAGIPAGLRDALHVRGAASSAIIEEKRGGIDLNPANMDMQTNYGGDKIQLPMPQMPLENIRIDGLVPIIIHVAPVTNLPLLLGLGDEKGTDTAEFAPQQSPVDAPRRFKAREVEEIGLLN